MIVLASASSARQAMLKAAGVAFTVDVAAIDEEAVKQGLRRETAHPGRAAETLAELKAVRVSARHPGALLCGERDGRRIAGFDLGNSPFEYGFETVGGRTLIFASTNSEWNVGRIFWASASTDSAST